MALRDEYPKGQRFRVIKAGGSLSGMMPMAGHSNAYQGWGQDLAVGEIITCLGYGPGWGSDPGYGIHFTTDKVRQDHVSFAEFRPMAGGAFDYHPADGYLEKIPEANQ
jgi:hypothetical protein